ncbi:hypothetical protein MKX01_019487, partial [Papaver californicum]
MELGADEFADLYADTRRVNLDFETRMLRVKLSTTKSKRIESLKSRYAGIIHKSEVYLHLR